MIKFGRILAMKKIVNAAKWSIKADEIIVLSFSPAITDLILTSASASIIVEMR